MHPRFRQKLLSSRKKEASGTAKASSFSCHTFEDPLPQATRTVNFILLHLEEYRAIMGPKGDPSFENRWCRNIAASFKDRFLREKPDPQSAGLACAIFSSTLIGIYRYFIFEAPDISAENFTIILGNTFKYALMDFQAKTK